MRLSQGLAALTLMVFASVAHAQFSATVTATSDYHYRAITQTGGDPALQGSVDWAAESGFYVGAWGSTSIDFACCDLDGDFEDFELDLYAGFSGGEDVTWDVGLVYYTYPTESDFNYPELYAEVGYDWVSGKIWYSNDFGNSSDSAFYYEINGAWDITEEFGANAHIGYSDGDAIDLFYEDSYFDWAVGVTYALGNFELGLKYIDGSDLEIADGTPGDVLSSEATAVFYVSTTFPWGSE